MEELFCSLKISNLNGDVNLEEIIDQPGGKSAHCIKLYHRSVSVNTTVLFIYFQKRLSHDLPFAVVLFATFYSFITPKTGAI